MILYRSKLLTRAKSSKITTMLIVLLIVLSTAYDPALPLHPYTAVIIVRDSIVGALK
jgi:hypothetical protein